MIVFIIKNNEEKDKTVAMELTRLSFTNATPDLITEDMTRTETENTLGVFPNPIETTSKIKFNNKKSDTYTFYVYNLNGQIIYSQEGELTLGTNEITFNRANHPSGIYVYELVLDKEDNKKGKLLFK